MSLRHLVPFMMGGAGGGAPGHVYWRVFVTNTADGTYTAAQEIEMRATSGGGNLCTGGTAFSLSFLAAGYEASKAFDGDLTAPTTGCWRNAGGLPDFIGYQFASPQAITEIKIMPQNNGFGPTYAPSDFTVQYSDDGSAYTTAATFTSVTGWTAGVFKTFSW